MGALYLYAITDQPELCLAIGTGLGDAQLRSITYGDIAAIVSPLAGEQIAPTAEHVLLHERVIEALMVTRTALPARFGMVLRSQQALQEALAKHYRTYLANLDRVRGRVELGLRVLWRAPELVPAAITRDQYSDGRSYMLARLAEERQAQAERQAAELQASEVSQHLSALAIDHVAEVLVTPRMLLKAAYLVEQTQIGAFQQAVQAQQALDGELRFLCTGPWPVYHFVTATD